MNYTVTRPISTFEMYQNCFYLSEEFKNKVHTSDELVLEEHVLEDSGPSCQDVSVDGKHFLVSADQDGIVELDVVHHSSETLNRIYKLIEHCITRLQFVKSSEKL